jgi:hypothetical protein
MKKYELEIVKECLDCSLKNLIFDEESEGSKEFINDVRDEFLYNINFEEIVENSDFTPTDHETYDIVRKNDQITVDGKVLLEFREIATDNLKSRVFNYVRVIYEDSLKEDDKQ